MYNLAIQLKFNQKSTYHNFGLGESFPQCQSINQSVHGPAVVAPEIIIIIWIWTGRKRKMKKKKEENKMVRKEC